MIMKKVMLDDLLVINGEYVQGLITRQERNFKMLTIITNDIKTGNTYFIEINKFASTILRAADIREESFDDEATVYQKNLHEAVKEALNEVDFDLRLLEVIYLLLATAWNDILDWAEKNYDGSW